MVDWSQAECRDTPTEWWFPEHNDPRHIEHLIDTYCGPCSIREACLEEALALPALSDYGVRGGTIPKERAVIRRARQRRIVNGSGDADTSPTPTQTCTGGSST